jgi:N-acyl-D-aspartate/D-glutamate deacylase
MGHDLLVRDGFVVDGSGLPRFRADVAIEGGVVVEVGRLAGRGARRVVDAGGRVVAPGFVDPHTHYDPQLHWDGLATPSLLHGVTTVVTGNCGVTLAPCRAADRGALARLFHVVEEIPLAAFERGIEWRWESFGECLDALEGRLGPNLVAFVGHSAIRYFAMGPASYEREASEEEIAAMRALLTTSLREGAAGFSTSQSVHHVGEGGRPIPSRLASDAEVAVLASVLAELGRGIFQTDGGPRTHEVPDHVRRVDGPIAERTGRPVLLSGTLHEWNHPEVWREVHAAIAEFQARGARIFTQASPVRLDLDFALDTAILFQDLPALGRITALPREEKLRAYRDPAVRDAIEREAVLGRSPCFFSRRWDTVFVAEAGGGGPRALVGQSVAEIARRRGARIADALCDLVVDADLDVRFRLEGSANGDDAAVAAMLRSPQALIGFSDAGAHVNTLCGAGDTSLVLARWVRERGVLGLEEAVRALSFQPASVLGLRGRGLLRPGFAADVVVFDPAAVEHRPPRRVADLPGGGERLWRDAPGIDAVIVNGELVVERGIATDARPGLVLRG